MVAALTAESALGVWERGRSLPMLERGLLLLALSRPELDSSSLLDASIGDRDGELLLARLRWFGGSASGVVECERCSNRTEMDLTLADLLTERRDDASSDFEHAGRTWRLRSPTTALLQQARRVHPSERRRALAQACLVAEDGGRPDVDSIDEDCCRRVAADLERLDPQADVRFAVECSHCGFAWTAAFDVVRFLWEDLEQFALRLLADVHLLARAYGWSEGEIMRLSPSRRGLYLRMVQG